MHRFKEQVAIVTGGARGIGEGIAKRLLSEGARVIIFDQSQGEIDTCVQNFKKEDLNLDSRCVDISNEADVKKAVESVAQQYHRIDIMVNSAGIVGPTATKITEYTYESFQKVVNVNLNGAFLMTKYVMPYMVKQEYGRVLLIASIGGKEGNPGMAGYAASKSGVIGLVKGIGKEYAGTGITVNGLAPAVIATPMNLETDKKMLEYMTSKIPMGRLGTVEETASICCWIVSKEASFNTGFVFDLSGGRATF